MPLPRVRRFRRSLVRGLPGVPRPRAALPSEGVLGLKIEASWVRVGEHHAHRPGSAGLRSEHLSMTSAMRLSMFLKP